MRAASVPEAFFLPLRRGRRFCVRYAPAGKSVGAILFVHAFAEEMNKARRMAAMQARALADDGWTVLQMDLFGCGDSEGEFVEASWAQWVSDINSAAAWMREQTGNVPSLWGMRTGCLLACAAAKTMNPVPDLLFWQPSISGKQALQQFLRLRVASQILTGPSREGLRTIDALRAGLQRGEAIEIAGYELSPGVASGLDAAELTPPGGPSRVAWLEVGSSDPPEPSPASQARVAAWQASGHPVTLCAIPGIPFWQTQEIAECPALIDATHAAIAEWRV